jgi:hypothetical protein
MFAAVRTRVIEYAQVVPVLQSVPIVTTTNKLVLARALAHCCTGPPCGSS